MYFALGAYGWPMYLLQNKTVSVIFCKKKLTQFPLDTYICCDKQDNDNNYFRVAWRVGVLLLLSHVLAFLQLAVQQSLRNQRSSINFNNHSIINFNIINTCGI